MYVPKKIFFTKGSGVHKERLTSFEMALRDARIAAFNLVRVSSIFPPHCEVIPVDEGLQSLSAGQIIHCVMSENATNEPSRQVAASVGVAIPRNKEIYGYLSEHHSFGQAEDAAGRYAENLAAEMFATTADEAETEAMQYDEKEAVWHISSRIVHTENITQIAEGDAKGRWTTVVACAVLLP